MKIKFFHRSILALTAAFFLTAAAHAADPTGRWEWTRKGRDDQVRTAILKLELKDGQLSGSVTTRNTEIAIGDASFKDDVVAFSVTRKFQDESFTINYSGKLSGDAIKGTIKFTNRDSGEAMTSDWTAVRAKSGAP